ncbi:MAG: ribosomal L7Ae/L30e/S12e/Gadd45 family protein [Clostridia bacterium]
MEELKNARKVVGLNQTVRAIEEQQAKMVFLAEDVDPKLYSRIEKLCEANGVSVTKVQDMKTLGKACGIDVKAAMACILV